MRLGRGATAITVATVSVVTVIGGLAANLASSLQNWPSWLRPIQQNPWLAFIILAALGVLLTVVTTITPDNDRQRKNRDVDSSNWLSSKPALIGNVPSKPAGYQERIDLLAKLKQSHRGQSDSTVWALTGMLGVGKTALAAEYARARHADGWRLVVWINANDKSAILSGLAQVASELGLKPEGSDAQAAGQAVRRGLETDGNRCLLVFNDATDLDALLPFLPAVGAAQVIITTNQQAAANLGMHVKVDVFTKEEALTFLSDLTESQNILDAVACRRTGLSASCAGTGSSSYRGRGPELWDLPRASTQTADGSVTRSHRGRSVFTRNSRCYPDLLAGGRESRRDRAKRAYRRDNCRDVTERSAATATARGSAVTRIGIR